ncbi:L-lactate dehydrogenase [Mycoplasmopsis agassizii]|uniref:L-lactate dehydrogenase n=1 Tax=Mycoplasmopsis agassizii TaxID=33922 RepID=A0ABX4H589_9BACT|nr:L-lactate dehydrogenase [Mycoplasmopsis agassizii]PAF54972.1 L-lactate dehydrogenase [Mycoplasmopsis agassizii]SMC17699.1 L-lactate dehydrogenase [Mycoplasmopsis agassizii]
MSHSRRKIALIGAGFVGTSFIAAAIQNQIAAEYGIIDLNVTKLEGNVLDFEDSLANHEMGSAVKVYDFKDLKDVSVIVITAGRPQKPGETRLEMVNDNARIMADIARKVKASGFNGVTVINANPVDVMTYVYAHVTGFEKNRVISSGTALETSRFKFEIAKQLGLNASAVSALVFGEHGDSSLYTTDYVSIEGIPYKEYTKDMKISEQELLDMMQRVRRKAYEIINHKGSTFYGIGATTAHLVRMIVEDARRVTSVGAYLNGEYGQKDLFIGVPAVLGINGVEKVVELDLKPEVKKQFDESARILKENIAKALEAIK